MSRIVRCGVIQATCEWSPEKYSLADIKEKMIAKHEKMIATAAKKNVQILGPAGAFLRPILLRRAECAMVRTDRDRTQRSDPRACKNSPRSTRWS